jgi:hypothetical protein
LKQLTEAAFLPHQLLGAGGGTGAFVALIRCRHRLVAVIAGFLGAAADLAFDEALVEAKIAVIADRDEAAGRARCLSLYTARPSIV